MMNTFNGGTRRPDAPDGGLDPLPREKLANGQAAFMVRMCLVLHAMGGMFTVENPLDSYLWKSSFLKSLFDAIPCFLVELDQCMYGLQLPGHSRHTFCRKRTGILSNRPSVRSLSCKCSGISQYHKHEHAFGARMVKGRSVRLASSAGTYPPALCHAAVIVKWERVA
jgi:hypothetical protein